jgi:hypothetical protein
MFRVPALGYEIGDTVETGSLVGPRLVLVTSRSQDIKNGSPGFDGLLINEKGLVLYDGEPGWATVWGYDHQIRRVISQGN